MRLYFKSVKRALIFLAVLAGNAHAQLDNSGIEFESTRVIYPEQSKNGINFTITNNTNEVYLLQSRVLPWDAETPSVNKAASEAPFIIIPPLVRFEPQSTVTLNIRMTENIAIKDRESVWRLALKTIPAQEKRTASKKKSEPDAELVLALQNNFKMFYRPSEIPVLKDNDREKMLKMTMRGHELTVNNPTPYYLTFDKLAAGAQSLLDSGNKMIAPFSEQRYPVNKPGAEVQWRLIRDDRRQLDHKFNSPNQ